MYKLTCVTGYWNVKNKHDNKFNDWFEKTLKINSPYIVFGDIKTLELIKTYRENIPTVYIEHNITDFNTYKYKDRMITHPIHCPSIELNLIWNEKIFLIKKALELNPFLSEFFCWIDAGICIYRNTVPPSTPFPNIEKLSRLPTNKFIYSSSEPYNDFFVKTHKYHHHISGTTYILHKNIIDTFANLYDIYLDKLVDKNNIWTDQVILTHIYRDNKSLFYKLCDGYGQIFITLS